MARLLRCIAGVAKGPGNDSVIRLEVSLPEPHLAVVASVHPATVIPMTRPLVAVALHRPTAMSGQQLGALAYTYGFTSAETRLAEAVLAGDSVRDASARLRLSYETTRTYLKRLLSKTGARRQ